MVTLSEIFVERSTVHSTHHYQVGCHWEGSTAVGYESYPRAHSANAPPSPDVLSLSSDPAFRGDPARLNPEQLLVMSASSCQLLSFLAVAAKARIDVRSYQDSGEAFMPEDDKPIRITSIILRPRIVVARGPSEERVRSLVEVAHRECYISNSLKTDIRVEPLIEFME